MSELVAGTSAVVLETPIGVEMMGYGARVGTATSLHDPLHARALYLAGDSDLLPREVPDDAPFIRTELPAADPHARSPETRITRGPFVTRKLLHSSQSRSTS